MAGSSPRNSREVKEYLRFYSPSCTFSNALSPIQVAVVSKALEIVRSERRRDLREQLMSNILSLREQISRRAASRSTAIPRRSSASRPATKRWRA